MAVTIGIDLGAISTKIGILGDPEDWRAFEQFQSNFSTPPRTSGSGLPFHVLTYTRIKGEPVKATLNLLRQNDAFFDLVGIRGIRVCGSGDALLGEHLMVHPVNEFTALAKGVELLSPEVRTVFEMGGNNARYLRLSHDGMTGTIGLLDYNKSGDCAAGTGAFLDQQASRMKFRIEEVGEVAAASERAAKIAGRCSVFAKSDMIHAQQKGYQPEEILRGLCEAVARNFKSNIVCSKPVQPPVAFVGGVAANFGVVAALRDLYEFKANELFVPEYFYWYGALGAALIEYEACRDAAPQKMSSFLVQDYTSSQKSQKKQVNAPLSLEKVILLRDQVSKNGLSGIAGNKCAYLGVDVGSVSTNLVVIDDGGMVLKEIYTRTRGRPIEVVNEGLKYIKQAIGHEIDICGVGTTGSGRELIGKLIGTDTINDEITAHKTGAVFISKHMLDDRVDTIFEIGGQDSKFISLEDGVVVDFTMNEACAAGTGSFLEERAEELEINIKKEFADLAMRSQNPTSLGERCTVFMERDVAAHQQQGALKEDLVAGLAYSVVYNYLNRVVRGRKIGDAIFFQGGTAYNDAVAAAFSQVLEKPIVVPPYNGVIGAIGAALLAREYMQKHSGISSFRGYSLENVNYSLREFVCKACSNYCNMQAFRVADETTYWGDQCSEKFRKRSKDGLQADIEDLFAVHHHYLYENYDPERNKDGVTMGIPHTMYMHKWLPFWTTYLNELGFRTVLSGSSNKAVKNAGQAAAVADPCFPVTVSHGHVTSLLSEEIDYILLPNMINAMPHPSGTNGYYCPWGQTLPFIVQQAPAMQELNGRLLKPTLEFGYGKEIVFNKLHDSIQKFGISKSRSNIAAEKAYTAQARYRRILLEHGQQTLNILQSEGKRAIVLVGRPYNIYDSGINLDIPKKLRDYYGVNIIPFDFLATDLIDIDDVNDNMFWHYGRKIIATARMIRDIPYLDLIYLTNFKCGPDSYIKHFTSSALGKPFLILQFDEHGNDAGYLTRCEAYLTSKGFLN